MAIVRNNPLLKGVSGMLEGTMVFKLLRGKTIVANRPRKPSRQSEAQRDNRLKFKEATKFAKRAMSDPVKKEYYWRKAKALKLPNAYTAAITDYMRKPDVASVTAKDMKHARQISVTAFKKYFALRSVIVQSLDMHRQVVDLCEAVHHDGHRWKFDMPANSTIKTFRIKITDDTGQTTSVEKPSP